MQKYINTAQKLAHTAWIQIDPMIHEYSLCPTASLAQILLQNEFYLQPNLCFARNLEWTKDATLNYGKTPGKTRTVTLPSALRAILSVQTTVLKVNNDVKIASTM